MEVFVRRLEEAFEQYKRQRLTGEEAGELLGMSGRNFRRLCVRYEKDGIEGLRDRRIGKVSPRRASERELERMHELCRERYNDFTVKHFHEQLVQRHGYKLCYTVTRLSLQAANLVAKAKRRAPQEAGAPAAAGHAAVPGRVDPSLDCGSGARSRSCRHAGGKAPGLHQPPDVSAAVRDAVLLFNAFEVDDLLAHGFLRWGCGSTKSWVRFQVLGRKSCRASKKRTESAAWIHYKMVMCKIDFSRGRVYRARPCF